ncbi:MAG: LTA synthase family protein [Spirochaetaceae bacterium]
MKRYNPPAAWKGVSKDAALFLIIFAAGFLLKNNFSLFWIYRVPLASGPVLRNLFHLLILTTLGVHLTRSRNGRVLLLGVSGVYTAFFLANLYYNRYFGNYLSYNDVLMGQGVRPVRVLTRQLWEVWDVLFIADLPALGFLFRRLKGEGRETTLRSALGHGVRANKKALLLALALLPTQALLGNLLLHAPSPRELFSRSTGGFAALYGVGSLYLFEIYNYHYRPEVNPTPSGREPADQISLGEEPAVAQQPNLVVIQVESLDARIIDFTYQGTEVSPFLNRMKDQHLYAQNFYAQHVNGSFDAEFSFLTSLYPLNRTYAFRDNDMSRFDSFVRILDESGYETLAFHANDGAFFHRNKAYEEIGFDRFYSREDFDEGETVFEGARSYFGLNDYDFLLQSVDYIEEAPEPFFAFLITVTSHTVFDLYPSSQRREAFADVSPVLTRDYFNSVAFLDQALEMFFAQMDARGLAEDTIFLLYSDHDAAVDSEIYSSHEQAELPPQIERPEHVPLMIIHEDIAPGVITKTGSHVDIAPTILDLLGAEALPDQFAGSSLLFPEEEPVLFLHEVPQILYKDHLFAMTVAPGNDGYEITEVGTLANPREEYVEIPESEQEAIPELIEVIRETFENHRVP